MGLVAPWHVGSSRTRARTRVPCIGRQILNHCATREVLKYNFDVTNFVFSLWWTYLQTFLLEMELSSFQVTLGRGCQSHAPFSPPQVQPEAWALLVELFLGSEMAIWRDRVLLFPLDVISCKQYQPRLAPGHFCPQVVRACLRWMLQRKQQTQRWRRQVLVTPC